jgi:hypothetical protein
MWAMTVKEQCPCCTVEIAFEKPENCKVLLNSWMLFPGKFVFDEAFEYLRCMELLSN